MEAGAGGGGAEQRLRPFWPARAGPEQGLAGGGGEGWGRGEDPRNADPAPPPAGLVVPDRISGAAGAHLWAEWGGPGHHLGSGGVVGGPQGTLGDHLGQGRELGGT